MQKLKVNILKGKKLSLARIPNDTHKTFQFPHRDKIITDWSTTVFLQ